VSAISGAAPLVIAVVANGQPADYAGQTISTPGTYAFRYADFPSLQVSDLTDVDELIVQWTASGTHSSSLSDIRTAPADDVPNFSFRRIADTATPIPGGVGTLDLVRIQNPEFNQFDNPDFSQGVVTLLGTGSGGQAGIHFIQIPDFDVLVDRSDAVPGGTGSFDVFAERSFDAGQLAFRADFRNGSAGVFVAALAEPVPALTRWGYALLAGLVIVAAALGSRRPRQAAPQRAGRQG
jgi:hypothetical protein